MGPIRRVLSAVVLPRFRLTSSFPKKAVRSHDATDAPPPQLWTSLHNHLRLRSASYQGSCQRPWFSLVFHEVTDASPSTSTQKQQKCPGTPQAASKSPIRPLPQLPVKTSTMSPKSASPRSAKAAAGLGSSGRSCGWPALGCSRSTSTP